MHLKSQLKITMPGRTESICYIKSSEIIQSAQHFMVENSKVEKE